MAVLDQARQDFAAGPVYCLINEAALPIEHLPRLWALRFGPCDNE